MYSYKKWVNDFFIIYNALKKLKDYNLTGEDNVQYVTPEGMSAWLTLNYRLKYSLNNYFGITIGIDNILDTQYRTFSSGINAPGRNIFASVNFKFSFYKNHPLNYSLYDG